MLYDEVLNLDQLKKNRKALIKKLDLKKINKLYPKSTNGDLWNSGQSSNMNSKISTVTPMGSIGEEEKKSVTKKRFSRFSHKDS